MGGILEEFNSAINNLPDCKSGRAVVYNPKNIRDYSRDPCLTRSQNQKTAKLRLSYFYSPIPASSKLGPVWGIKKHRFWGGVFDLSVVS